MIIEDNLIVLKNYKYIYITLAPKGLNIHLTNI